MAFRGTFKVKNLNAGDKITVGPSRGNSSPPPQSSGPSQYLIVNGIEYLLAKSGSVHQFFAEPSWNRFNNKTVDIEGTFVGQLLFVSSITQV